MTAMLEEIRRLDAARKRGDISAEEYAVKRGALLESVEDVEVVSSATTGPKRPPRPSTAPRYKPQPTPHRRPEPQARAQAAPRPNAPRPNVGTTSDTADAERASHLWGLFAIGLVIAGLLTFMLGRLIGDITIALTLTVTVFAAILIAAFQRMQE